MSDQEMQFADPEWQPPRQRHAVREQATNSPVDVDDTLRQQTGEYTAERDEHEKIDDRDYASGYRAESTNYEGQNPQISVPPPRRRRWLWAILAAIFLAVLVVTPVGEDTILVFWRVLLAVLVAGGVIWLLSIVIRRGRNTIASTETHSFTVGAQPKILIKDDFGSIRVHPGGEEHQVIVRATKRSAMSMGGDIRVDIQQNTDKNSIIVKTNGGWSFLGSKSVDFDITVPSVTDLDLKVDAGSIYVNGINSQLSCTTDAGSVNVTDVLLRGSSKLKTDAGSVTFSGRLDPTGSYHMATDAGTITVTLPDNSSFRLDAKTDVGTINSDFPIDMQRNFPGGKVRCDVGFPPYPTLKLRTDVGTITVRSSQK